MSTPAATRRAMMLAVAAAPLATAAPAVAHPDADLLRLEQERDALDRATDAYAVELSRLEEEVEAAAGPMPDVLRVTADDRAAWLHTAPWWTAYNVGQLRAQLPRLQRHVDARASEGVRWTLDRAREVVSSWDAREGARAARLAATRHPDVEMAYDATVTKLAAVEDRIAAATPTTLAGFRVKAQLVAKHFQVAGGEPDFGDELVLSLLRDLGAL